MPILFVDNLNYSYSSNENAGQGQIHNLSFSIDKGEYVVLAGANGSGKSTLVRLICGFLNADSGTIVISEEGSKEKGTVPTGMVFQSPRDQLVANTVANDTAFGPENIGLTPSLINERVKESLTLTALLEMSTSKTISLSLGQKQKLAFAGIIALHPSLLILDESLSMVDTESRSEILSFIKEYHEAGNSIIHVTHIAEEIQRAQRVLFLKDGELHFDDSPEKYFALQSSIKAKEECSKKLPVSADTPLTLELKNITYSPYMENQSAKRQPLFKNLSLSFAKGTLTALTGKSGSGKSTLMELASGLWAAQSGSVFCKQRPVLALQESEAALFEEFAADDVAYALYSRGINGQELVERTRSAMELASLSYEQFANRRTFTLSGGEKRKLSIAGIVAIETDVYFFDEPTAGLDAASSKHIVGLLRTLALEGKTVVFSTHSKEEELLADRIVRLENGCVVFDSDTTTPTIEANQTTSLPKQEPFAEAKRLSHLQEAAFGMYEAKKSIIHALHPVLKYICMFILLLSGFISHSLEALGVVIGFSILYAIVARLPLQNLLKNMIKIMPWLVFFFLLQVFFFEAPKSDTVYFAFGKISVTDGKVFAAIRTMLHYVAALIVLSVFLYTTDESEILEGLRDILHPLTLLKIPTHHIVLVVGMIFRFIPLLAEEAVLILKAQTIRSGHKKKRGLFKNIRSMMPIFIPLMLQTLRRAEAFADALQARYYDS